MIRFKQNVVKHDSANDVACPQGTTFLQYVGDNTDHNTATIDGKIRIMDLAPYQWLMETLVK